MSYSSLKTLSTMVNDGLIVICAILLIHRSQIFESEIETLLAYIKSRVFLNIFNITGCVIPLISTMANT